MKARLPEEEPGASTLFCADEAEHRTDRSARPQRLIGAMHPRLLLKVSIDLLDPNPNQPRKQPHDLEALAKSLAKCQLQPFLVRRSADRYLIIDGHRRWEACRLAGITEVEVLVEEDLLPAQAILHEIAANTAREALTPMELAHSFARAIKVGGWTQAQIAETAALGADQVSKTLRLLDLDKTLQEQVGTTLPLTAAYELSRITDHAEQRRLADMARAQGCNRDAFTALIAETKGKRPRKPNAQHQLVLPLSDGRQLALRSAHPMNLDEFIEMLDALRAEARKARARNQDLPALREQLHSEARTKRKHTTTPSEDVVRT